MNKKLTLREEIQRLKYQLSLQDAYITGIADYLKETIKAGRIITKNMLDDMGKTANRLSAVEQRLHELDMGDGQ